MKKLGAVLLFFVFVTNILMGCTPSSTNSTNKETVGIIAIGHSGLTGEGSDPNHPGQDAKEYSWATGTSTDVNSVYMRLVAVRPETEGHVANLAVGGSPATALASQAKAALAQVPSPELVLIQTMDSDIRCDGSDAENVKDFGEAVANALQVIVQASPESHIIIVSQRGRPAKYADAISNDPIAKADNMGTGMCDLFDPDGNINQEHIKNLTAIIESYEAEQARVCATIPQCSTDSGAFANNYVDNISDLSIDMNHLNVKGQASLAEIIWPVVSDILGYQ